MTMSQTARLQFRVKTSRDELWSQALEALDLAACLSDSEIANAQVTFYCMMLEQAPTDRWLDFGEVETKDGECFMRAVLTDEFTRGFVARALRMLGKRRLAIVR
jgi:hypothetical protein